MLAQAKKMEQEATAMIAEAARMKKDAERMVPGVNPAKLHGQLLQPEAPKRKGRPPKAKRGERCCMMSPLTSGNLSSMK
jgi:hypothetical protein